MYLKGISVKKRWREINEIYNEKVKTGVTNRYIWLKFIYPAYGISERQMYNILKRDDTLD